MVHVRFAALPAHVRTARLIAAAVARRAGVDESLLDEVRLAVGEACSRAVGLHEQHAPHELVALELSCDDARFVVEVTDVAPADSGRAPVDLRALDPERLAAPSDEDAGEPAAGGDAGAADADVGTGSGGAGNAVEGPADAPGPSRAAAARRAERVPDLLPAGFGLGVIVGLVDDVRITHDTPGSRVRMSWPVGQEHGARRA
jgi:anti-sigma regulatory factor (Ser/Thr protein kinase)